VPPIATGRFSACPPKTFFVAILTVSAHAMADVDPDCFAGELSVTCSLNRVDEAKDADKLFRPVLEKLGWDWSCYRVQYIHGDNGGPDTLSVVIFGPKGSKAPECIVGATPKLEPEVQRDLEARGAGVDEAIQALSKQARKEGAAKAANKAQLKKIGVELKKVIAKASDALREEILRKADKLSLGSGYGDDFDLPLP
jgi:hypothetical protein